MASGGTLVLERTNLSAAIPWSTAARSLWAVRWPCRIARWRPAAAGPWASARWPPPLLGGLAGPGTLALANSASSAVALSVGNNSANTTFSGMLQGAGSLTKVGSGTLLLTGSNIYTGATTVNQGILSVNGWLVEPGDGQQRRHLERHGQPRQRHGHSQRANCPAARWAS